MVDHILECRICDRSISFVLNCRNYTVGVGDLEAELICCDLAASECLAACEVSLALCCVEVHKCVSKFERILLEQCIERQLSIGFRRYSYLDQALLVVMKRCCDVEDSGIICHTVVGVCPILVLHCTFRNGFADRVMNVSIHNMAILILVHVIQRVIDLVKYDLAGLVIVLGLKDFTFLILQVECELSFVQDPAEQCLFCLEFECSFSRVSISEVVLCALGDLDIQLSCFLVDLFIGRFHVDVQIINFRIISEVRNMLILLRYCVVEACSEVFNCIDNYSDDVAVLVITSSGCTIRIDHILEVRIRNVCADVLDLCKYCVAFLDDKCELSVLRHSGIQPLDAGETILTLGLVGVRELLACLRNCLDIQFRFIISVDRRRDSDLLAAAVVICDTCLSIIAGVLHFGYCVNSFRKIFHIVVDNCD